MKTLYVTDLDKTLLRDDQTLSEFTVDTINSLTEKGMIFTYATARSSLTADRACRGLSGAHLAVVYNGAFTVDRKRGEVLSFCTFSKSEGEALLKLVLEGGIAPRVFSLIDGEERFTYTSEHLKSLGAQEYFRTRSDDPRARLGTESDLFEGDIFEISCVDRRDLLEPLYEKAREVCQCCFYKDSYSEDWYLEILPAGATKAAAILRLKELLGCERVVCFGDGMNDFSMFEIADECYAVSNAHPRLKEMATGIIGSNEDDGVARFLLSRFGDLTSFD